MNNKLLLPLLGLGLISSGVYAEENDICNTPLFKQMIAAEKQDMRRPNIRPNSKLKDLMNNYEILCPLQVEKDFNGDKRLDWFGVLEKNGKFYLMAYLSGTTKHQLIEVKTYDSPPNKQYFDVATQKRLNDVAGYFEFKPNIKFAAVENRMDGTATAYLWDGSAMKSLVDFRWPVETE